MGWGSATHIFDTVANALEAADVPEDSRMAVLERLYHVLRDGDWDTYEESDYVDWVRMIDPDAFDDDDY